MEFTTITNEFCRFHVEGLARGESGEKVPSQFLRLTADTIRRTPMTPDDKGKPDYDGKCIVTCVNCQPLAAKMIHRLWRFADVDATWLEEILNPVPTEPESDAEPSGEGSPATGEGKEPYKEPEGSPSPATPSASVADILNDLGGEGDETPEPNTGQARVRTMEKAPVPDELSTDGKDSFKEWRIAEGKSIQGRASKDDKLAWAATLTPQLQTKYVKSWK